jgi:hypothetical protein
MFQIAFHVAGFRCSSSCFCPVEFTRFAGRKRPVVAQIVLTHVTYLSNTLVMGTRLVLNYTTAGSVWYRGHCVVDTAIAGTEENCSKVSQPNAKDSVIFNTSLRLSSERSPAASETDCSCIKQPTVWPQRDYTEGRGEGSGPTEGKDFKWLLHQM